MLVVAIASESAFSLPKTKPFLGILQQYEKTKVACLCLLSSASAVEKGSDTVMVTVTCLVILCPVHSQCLGEGVTVRHDNGDGDVFGDCVSSQPVPWRRGHTW